MHLTEHLAKLQAFTASLHVPILLIIGGILCFAFYLGKASKKISLPSLIGYMLFGVVAGPSLLNVLNEEVVEGLSFIPEMALAFVALSIGLELQMSSLKQQGIGIVSIILAESFAAFLLTVGGVYLLTRDLPLSLIFGSFAPASAPAGTVAVIKEYRAKGSLTKALYAVVGFDDGLAIIIFAFAAALAKMLLDREMGAGSSNVIVESLLEPGKEIVFSLVIGGIIAFIARGLLRRLQSRSELLIMVGAITLITTGICSVMHLSLILTNMVVGLILVNTQPVQLTHRISEALSEIMPLFFTLFFTLAGANLHISALGSLGLLGAVYIICRSAGLMGGAALGATVGNVEPKIRKYVGMGILSQAGVAIGLAMIVKHEFAGLGKVVSSAMGVEYHRGDIIGTIGITTVTATCIFFEVIGPILTKIALTKAGEISPEKAKA